MRRVHARRFVASMHNASARRDRPVTQRVRGPVRGTGLAGYGDQSIAGCGQVSTVKHTFPVTCGLPQNSIFHAALIFFWRAPHARDHVSRVYARRVSACMGDRRFRRQGAHHFFVRELPHVNTLSSDADPRLDPATRVEPGPLPAPQRFVYSRPDSERFALKYRCDLPHYPDRQRNCAAITTPANPVPLGGVARGRVLEGQRDQRR